MSKESELIGKIADYYNGDVLHGNGTLSLIESWLKDYAKERAEGFFKWNALKVSEYVDYLSRVNKAEGMTAKELESTVFEGANISGRYDLYIKSIDSDPIIYDNKHPDHKDIRNLENEELD